MADPDPTLADGFALGGALVVAVGTYVPWIVTSPDADVVPAVYLSGMEWGVVGHDYLVLGLLVAGLAAAARYRSDRRGGYLAAATGVGVALSTVSSLASTLGGFLGSFVPGPGAVLTVVGGLLVVVAGWRHLAVGAGEREAGDGTGTPG